jgi:succinate dehydrogenase / fumarate reductase cytochrome b subunit
MAFTGILLVGFVVGHMAGNLKAFAGPESFNAYAAFLREVGYPLLPHGGLLWIMRLGLLAAVGLHIWAAYSLTRTSRAARVVEYRNVESQVFNYASRTMRWGGVIILIFLLYHLAHMTTGQVHPAFEHGNPYHNLVAGFQNPLVVSFYALAVSLLAFHLYHGVWSMFQTLGVTHPRYDGMRRPLAGIITAVTLIGFLAVPLAVQLGVIS